MSGTQFDETDLTSPITRFAVPILFEAEGKFEVLGTAVGIGLTLFITAKHVLEEALQRYEGIDIVTKKAPPDFISRHAIHLLQMHEGTGIRRLVRRVWTCPYTDIAFLGVDRLADGSPYNKVLRGTLVSPKKGDRLAAFGYPNAVVSVGEGIKIDVAPKTAVGHVVEVHRERRDQRIPWPALQTDARFDGGMSGGPVVNAQGRLIGVVSSNMPPYEPDEPHVSYVALLWPMLATMIDAPTGLPELNGRYPVRRLAELNCLALDGWQYIGIRESGAPYADATRIYAE